KGFAIWLIGHIRFTLSVYILEIYKTPFLFRRKGWGLSSISKTLWGLFSFMDESQTRGRLQRFRLHDLNRVDHARQ
ncbi:hypothetical protein, partial [Thermoactinomyces sp. CICC 10521]|uniref:hypothetical protein n=1 Tax=Thermoactinomyces sp. CICC 10521 TaxID=2767426 RepID=UPI001E3DA9F4